MANEEENSKENRNESLRNVRRAQQGAAEGVGASEVGDSEVVGSAAGVPAPADTRNSDYTYAAGDCVAYIASLGTDAPIGFEDLDAATWKCLGWLDTAGGVFALSHTTKDIGAAGSLSAIRTVITGGNKTLQVTCLEALNPYARALFDDVPPETLAPVGRVDTGATTTSGSPTVNDANISAGDVGSSVTGTGIPVGATIVSVTPGTSFVMSANATAAGTVSVTVTPNFSKYALPEVPLDNRYCLVFDTVDGSSRQRLFAPNAKVTARANDQIQQADAEQLQMTFTFFPTMIGSERGELIRYIGYPNGEVPASFSMSS